jgi:2-polyprenyl-3-methyl-5-hydroxy-6-metoxy-1,4-benzoquinol methylase
MTVVEDWLLPLLCCVECRADLALRHGELLACTRCHAEYPIGNGVPRFVPPDNYASSFGLQWNRFARTQLDSVSGHPISRDRFFTYSGWAPEDLQGALVLDVGCGAGRFTEVAQSCGARVVAMDYSSAVNACRANHAGNDRVAVVQADIYRLPFKAGVFDRIYCFGVLQHTPDVAAAFQALPRMLRPGGAIAVDLYPKLWTNALWPKYWLRPLTSRMRPERLARWVEHLVRWGWPLSRAVSRVPLVGHKLRYAIPIVNYEGVYPLSPEQMKEWALLDTFDMLSPTYDQPQDAPTLQAWMKHSGLEAIEVFRSGFLIGRGRKPA